MKRQVFLGNRTLGVSYAPGLFEVPTSSFVVPMYGTKMLSFCIRLRPMEAFPVNTNVYKVAMFCSPRESGIFPRSMPFSWRQYDELGNEISRGGVSESDAIANSGANITLVSKCTSVVVSFSTGVAAKYPAIVDGKELQLTHAWLSATPVSGNYRAVAIALESDDKFIDYNSSPNATGLDAWNGYGSYPNPGTTFRDLGPMYVGRHFSSSGYKFNNDCVMVPVCMSGEGFIQYACYGIRHSGGSGPYDLTRIHGGCIVKNVLSNLFVETGTGWGSTVSNNIYPGTGGFTRRSTDAGAATTGTITGTSLFLRSYVSTNSGIAVVQIDGSWTAANKLPKVLASDYKAITNVVDNGATAPRVTCNNHGFVTGARINIENVGGVAVANGNFVITVVDANTFDLTGVVFAGTYTSGGSASYFRGVDLGRCYINQSSVIGPLEDEMVYLASGLSNSSHTVRIENVGGANFNGIPGTNTSTGRVYVVALSAPVTGIADPNASGNSFLTIEDVLEFKSNSAGSTLNIIPKFAPTGGTMAFIGGVHTAESQSGFFNAGIVRYVDGGVWGGTSTWTPAYQGVEYIVTTNVPHPDGGGIGVSGNVATKRVSYKWMLDPEFQLIVDTTINYTANGNVEEVFHGALTVLNQAYRGLTDTTYTRARVNGEIVGPWSTANTSSPIQMEQRNLIWDTVVFESPSTGWSVGMTCLDASGIGGLSIPGSRVLIQDRQNTIADGGAKAYFQVGQSGTSRAVVANETVHRSSVGYRLWPTQGWAGQSKIWS